MAMPPSEPETIVARSDRSAAQPTPARGSGGPPGGAGAGAPMSGPPQGPKPRRRIWPWLLGCAGLVVIGCFAAGVGGYFFFNDWLQENLPGLLPTPQKAAGAHILD